MTYQLRLIVTLLLTWAASHAVAAPKDYQLLPDSSNFVRASVVIASPGNEFYSNLGHTAIRLECPIHDLDYCYSFLTDDSTLGLLNFFSGKSEGNIRAVPTEDYFNPFIFEGRGLKQYTLNLTLHEKQRLWELLDNDMVDHEQRKFNFAQNNCTTVALMMLRGAMREGDRIKFDWPEPTCHINNNNNIKFVTRNAPWMTLLCLMLSGTEGEVTWENIYRICPETLSYLLENSIIENGSESRPLITGEIETIAETKVESKPFWLTPNLLFSVILVIVLFISFAEWKWKWLKAAHVMDYILLITQTIFGVLLMIMTLDVGMFGIHWNWMLILFNPLPILVWLVWRKRSGWKKIYLTYAIVLSILMVYGITSTTLFYLPIILIFAIFAVRCWAKYLLLSTATPAK